MFSRHASYLKYPPECDSLCSHKTYSYRPAAAARSRKCRMIARTLRAILILLMPLVLSHCKQKDYTPPPPKTAAATAVPEETLTGPVVSRTPAPVAG